ncbi:hypothetical protein [Leptolyngbya sp. AN10]|uniref:hypothetical protein n=1 Tax=Leptolyngbya sp. AN10 TaxID=3423365 RepID=UPI003D30FDD9
MKQAIPAIVLSITLMLNACQSIPIESASPERDQAVIQFIQATFPTQPSAWIKSLPPKVNAVYRSQIEKSLQQQFNDCKECVFALDRIQVNTQGLPAGEWEVKLRGKLTLPRRSISFHKMLTVKEVASANSAKQSAFEIEQIKEIE